VRNELKVERAAPKRVAQTMLIVAVCMSLLFAAPLSAQPVDTCITRGAGTERLCTTHLSAMSHSIRITEIPSNRTTGFTVYGPRAESKDIFNSIDTMLSELDPTKSAVERTGAMQRLTYQATTRTYGEERFGACTLLLRFGSNDIAFKVTRR
jgi:hypothetical protein